MEHSSSILLRSQKMLIISILSPFSLCSYPFPSLHHTFTSSTIRSIVVYWEVPILCQPLFFYHFGSRGTKLHEIYRCLWTFPFGKMYICFDFVCWTYCNEKCAPLRGARLFCRRLAAKGMVTKVLQGEKGQALPDKLQNKRYSTEGRIFQAQRIAPGRVLS